MSPTEVEIAHGNAFAPGEALVWRGRPSWRHIACDALHVRGVGAYFALLFVLDALQAWRKAIPLAQAVHDSVPLAVIALSSLAILCGFAVLVVRTTRYTITDKRVILHYGLALSATLAIPMTRIVTVAVAVDRDGTADIALQMKADSHLPYLKLWPHARPWSLRDPQPMLRGVPQGGAVAVLLTRALQVAEMGRARPALRFVEPELLSA